MKDNTISDVIIFGIVSVVFLGINFAYPIIPFTHYQALEKKRNYYRSIGMDYLELSYSFEADKSHIMEENKYWWIYRKYSDSEQYYDILMGRIDDSIKIKSLEEKLNIKSK